MALQCMKTSVKTYPANTFESFQRMSYAIKHWCSHFQSGTGRDSRKEFEKGPVSPNGIGFTEGVTFSPLQIEHWKTEVKSCSEGTREAVLKTHSRLGYERR